MLPASQAKVWTHNGITGGYLAEWIVWPETREAIVFSFPIWRRLRILLLYR